MNDFYKKINNIPLEYKRTAILIVFLIAVVAIGGIFYSDKEARKKQCQDSDGNNIYNKGSILYTDANGRHVDEDYCTPEEKSVHEMTCKRTALFNANFLPTKTTVDCTKGCINGACLK
jgi:hypothetical protein